MSTEAPFTPPKKKPNIFWWLGGVFLLLLLVFFVQLFGPNPRIIVSPRTTYITGPLLPDGLPDYERYILDRSRDGVTPENNAAALLWPALWPGELDPPQYAAVAAELGLDTIPSQADAVVPVYKQITNWFRTQQLPSEDSDSFEQELDQTIDQVFDQVMSRPWTSEQFPWLAKWARDNQKPLDKILEASRRPRCYFPSPSMLDNNRDGLVTMLLPGVQGVRECGRSLTARAMWHVGEQRPDAAWLDLLATHRIGRLVAQGPTMVEQLVGIAIAGIAGNGTVAMLHEGRTSASLARQILRDLQTLEYFTQFADSLDNMERLSFLDGVTQLSRGDFDARWLEWGGVESQGRPLTHLQHLCVDWNIVLRKGNEFYDRYSVAARLPTYEAREQAMAKVEQDLRRLFNRTGIDTLVASALNPSARSDAATGVMLGLFFPAVDAALDAQDRANAKLDLLRLAAALAVYRAEHGDYPQKLDDLVPGVLEKLPVDLYHAKPFIYKRIDDGYLLYSPGGNGQDDGGSNGQMRVFEGRSLDDDNNSSAAQPPQPAIPTGADDISIRVPRPPLKPPQTAPSKDE